MLAIELAKLPPPTPPSAATSSSTPNGVSGLETTMPSSTAGMSSSPAETIVQLRPPKIDHEGVRESQRGADETRQRDQPEQLGAREVEAGAREHHDDDAPQLPDDEAEELGEDRPAQVAAR